MASNKAYLGTSIAFPLVVENGAVTTVTGNDTVEQSILDIVATQAGEVFFNRSYGTSIQEYMFDPNDDVLESLLEIAIAKAIKKWEGRVTFVGVKTVIEDSKVTITTGYRILGKSEINSVAYTYSNNG